MSRPYVTAIVVAPTGARRLLTAGGAAGKVRVVGAKGEAESPYELEIPANRTRDVRVKAKGDFAVVLTPIAGEVGRRGRLGGSS
ncbi:hypothetical protein ABZW11_01320 [Nonomuraea sp. NPDC004580]|uniref:hypothetical protein n=1 Tax=Nonomuraea sp. NPDC004580 TaxID=3154552 RepID=UPI0033A126D3